MPTTNLSFAKIAATPTDSAWSQAYNSGSLFITLALTTEEPAQQEQLPALGKTVLGLLESEIYALAKKNVASISAVITESVKDVPPEVVVSLSLSFVKENALYGFVFGTGKILLKRGEKIGPILQVETHQNLAQGGSGYLETNDLVLIQTAQFAKSVSDEKVAKALEYGLPNDIAETISPHVHGEKEGGAALIILSYQGISRSQSPDEDLETDTLASDSPIKKEAERLTEPDVPLSSRMTAAPIINQPIEEGEPATSPYEKITSLLSGIKVPFISGLEPRKKITLGVAALLIIVLAVSIIFVGANQESSKNKALFASIYESASEDFQSGSDLLSLNPSLAREDFLRAQETLRESEGKFKEGSTEKEQLDDLSGKIESALEGTEGKESIEAKEADESEATALRSMNDDSKILAVTEDEDNGYLLTGTSIQKQEKGSDDIEEIIKNDSVWTGGKSIGVFGSNLYVLDKESIIKIVPAGNSYADSNYLTQETDLTDAVGMTIDSSIYVLYKDGSIDKFTRGAKVAFSVSGLTTELSSPTAIATNEEADKILVLDPKNKRLVALNKDGSFSKQYGSDILSTARAMTISQDGKTVFVLSNKKSYKISL